MAVLEVLDNSNTISTSQSNNEEWIPKSQPTKQLILDEKALYGFAGEFVYEATRQSEASLAAVLMTFLTRFGCEVYNPETQAPFLQIGESRHYPRLFVAICGQTAKARKGTSAKPVERLFTFQDKSHKKIQTTPGPLSSGEGLIYAVREPISIFDEENNKEKIIDIGASDKRLFVLDEELAAALKVTKREGNTLSTVIRGLWDNGCASPITKGNRISTTNAHVCIVAHITKDELSSSLQNVELLNGFGNRFLWALVHRSKLVPLPQAIPDTTFNSLQQKVLDCINYGKLKKEFTFSEKTKEIWCDLYSYLSRDKAGLIGAVTDRAEAQTARLSLIFALLDKKCKIEPEHLYSALAVWNYCEESSKIIFSGRGEHALDDKLLHFLSKSELTLTEISHLLKRNVKSAEIQASLERLISAGHVTYFKRATSGRTTTVFSLKTL